MFCFASLNYNIILY